MNTDSKQNRKINESPNLVIVFSLSCFAPFRAALIRGQIRFLEPLEPTKRIIQMNRQSAGKQ